MRLQATGQLDSQFGDGGRTWIDLFFRVRCLAGRA